MNAGLFPLQVPATMLGYWIEGRKRHDVGEGIIAALTFGAFSDWSLRRYNNYNASFTQYMVNIIGLQLSAVQLKNRYPTKHFTECYHTLWCRPMHFPTLYQRVPHSTTEYSSCAAWLSQHRTGHYLSDSTCTKDTAQVGSGEWNR